MRVSAFRFPLSAFISAFACLATSAALAASPHPDAQRLIDQGFAVADGQLQRLPPPTVTPDMTAKEQRRAVERLVGKTRVKAFLRDSVVSRIELDVPTLGKTPDGATVRGLDLAFVVHANLDAIRDQNFTESSLPEDPDSDFETYFEPLDGRPDPDEVDPVEWAAQPRLHRYRFPLLEKVVVAGLLSGRAVVDERVVVQTIAAPLDRLDDADNPSVWHAIPRGGKGDADLAPAKPFRGLAGYLQATKLKFEPGAVLVEAHGVYAEPRGWFGGRNLLASKLPLAMQDSVRKFRRELAKQKIK